jgi:hypothetical protein
MQIREFAESRIFVKPIAIATLMIKDFVFEPRGPFSESHLYIILTMPSICLHFPGPPVFLTQF